MKTFDGFTATFRLVVIGLAAFGLFMAALEDGVFLQQATQTARKAAETLPEDEALSAQLHRRRARMGAGLVSVSGAAKGSATITRPSCESEK